jgi:hypothetical protein
LLSFNERWLIFMQEFSLKNTAPNIFRWTKISSEKMSKLTTDFLSYSILEQIWLFWGGVYWLRHLKMDKQYCCRFFCFISGSRVQLGASQTEACWRLYPVSSLSHFRRRPRSIQCRSNTSLLLEQGSVIQIRVPKVKNSRQSRGQVRQRLIIQCGVTRYRMAGSGSGQAERSKTGKTRKPKLEQDRSKGKTL